MAGETTTTTMTDTVYAAIIAEDILEELRPHMVMRGFIRWGPAGSSKAYKFPLLTKPALPAALAEGADLGLPGAGNTAIGTTSATVTAGQIAQKATVTKLLIRTSILDAMGTVSS